MITVHTLRFKCTGDARELRSPNDGRVIAEVEFADDEIAHGTLGMLEDAKRSEYGKMPAYRRAEILAQVAQKIRARAEELAILIASEGGKPLKDARIEVARAANTTQLAAEEATRIVGEGINMEGSA